MAANRTEDGSSGHSARPRRDGLFALSRGRLLAAALALVLVLAGVIVAALGGGGGAHPSSPAGAAQARRAERTSEVRAAAQLLGLSTPALRRELRSGRSLAEAAAAHGVAQAALVEHLVALRRAAVLRNPKLDSRQRERRLSQLRKTVEAVVRRRGPLPGAAGVSVPAAARYLGMSIPELRTRLSRGSTLAELAAGVPGRSATGLVAVLVSTRKRNLAAMVANGALTQAQQAGALSTLTKRIEAIVYRRIPPA